jgi:hypothetical protein
MRLPERVKSTCPPLPVHQGQQMIECNRFHSRKKEMIGLLCEKMRIYNIFQKNRKEGHYEN